jgi:UDP-glucose 4-epimerase
VGSGKGKSIVELCERVVRATASTSQVEIVPARAVEVVRFLADISAAQRLLGLSVPADPLFGLEEVVAAAKRVGSVEGPAIGAAA